MNDRERVAYHEAAHAVAAWALWRPFEYATIVAGEESNGHVQHIPIRDVEDFVFPGDYDSFALDRAVIALVGYAAESVAAETNWPTVDVVCHRMTPDDVCVIEFSLAHSSALVDRSDCERLEYDITAPLAAAYERAESLIAEYWGEIVAVAMALIEKDTLTEVEVAKIACEARAMMPPLSNTAS